MFFQRFLPRPRRAFAADIRGTAGLELALITPLALVALMGVIEYSRAITMSRRFNLVTATVSDLIARDDYETDATMAGLKHAVETIWSPYDKSSLVLQVVVVRQGLPTGTKPLQNYVYWSRPLSIDGATQPNQNFATCTPYSGLPANMLAPGNSTVIVNAKYTYRTLFGTRVAGFVSPQQNWTSSSSHSPRNVCVGYGAFTCATNCES